MGNRWFKLLTAAAGIMFLLHVQAAPTQAEELPGENNKPIALEDAYSTLEENELVVAAPGVLENDSDGDDDGLTAVLVTGPANGTLVMNPDGSFSYTPNLDFYGTDTFTYTANDGMEDSDPATVTITVENVNDPPDFTTGPNITTAEDFPPQTIVNWATDITAGPNESDQSVSFIVTNNNNALFAVQPAISANGTLTFFPAPNANGQAMVTATLMDDGGTANGGKDTSVTRTFMITVVSVNDAPTISSISDQSVNEDNMLENVPFTVDDIDSNLTNLTITGSSSNTMLVPSENIVFGGGGANRTVTITPASGQHGTTTITLTVMDDYGAKATVAFILTVNGKPAITAIADQTIDEDAATGALAFSVGDPETPAANLTVTGSSSNPELVPDANIVFGGSGANRTVTVTPAANAYGTATITLTVTDEEGFSSDTTFHLTVHPVNDAPSFAKGADQTVNEDAGAQTVPNWAAAIAAGPGESDQSVSFEVTTDNDALFAVLPEIDAAGTLTFTPAPDAYGSAAVTVVLKDDGGTANGGVDASAPETFTITVNSVNDAPTISAIADQSVNEDSLLENVPFTVDDADTDLALLTITASSSDTAIVPDANIYIDGSGANRTVTIEPAANAYGTSAITLTVTDEVGLSSNIIFNLTVHPVNDAPTDIVLSSDRVTENVPRGTEVGTLSAVDADPNETFEFSLTAGEGDTDNATFVIEGDKLKTNAEINYEQKTSFNIRVSVRDSSGAIFEKQLVIRTINVNESSYVPSTIIGKNGDDVSIDVFVDGIKQERFAAASIEVTADGQKVVTVAINNDKVISQIVTNNNQSLTISAAIDASKVDSEMNAELIHTMGAKNAVIEVRTNLASYKLPAAQIDISKVIEQFGDTADLKDIKVRISISQSNEEDAASIMQLERSGTIAVVVPPVEFEVTAAYGDKTVPVNHFKAYVERMIPIPEGTDPSKITTGVVLNSDGTISHVPTKMIEADGKYYAVINSLTNSTYAVVWNPKEFDDVKEHWSRDDVNDMGSRLVVSGVSDTKFNPDADVTRAEFVAIVVRGLGLHSPLPGNHKTFSDVSSIAWYKDAVDIAVSYGLISGYNDGTFRPNDKITRAEAVVVIGKAMKLAGLASAQGGREADLLLAPFKDGAAVASWARQAAADAVKHGILTGKGEKLNLEDNITRAETASVVRRLLLKSDLIN